MTSQVLANVYLHEFDFFVRHTLKPLGYMRYGDDFLLIAKTPQQALSFQQVGTIFLKDHLHLELHARNNVLAKPYSGLRYLGVTNYPNSQTLSNKNFMLIRNKLTSENYTSYAAYVNRYGSQSQRLSIEYYLDRFEERLFHLFLFR